MEKVKYCVFGIVISILTVAFTPKAQTVHLQNSSDIQLALEKLDVLGSVLYVAAHPDDENTSLISYYANELKLRTGYLSLTRGDGGQNLLGPEKGDLLGVLRTQELLAARRIDHGEQFFTRAVDFGYSKTSEETLRNWDRDSILYDMVKVIRKFRPDVIITRFSEVDGGHGHHLASAILAKEAFHMAADSNMFADQLNELEPWQAKRIVWNTWKPTDKATSMEVGGYNSLLGMSYAEMAAKGRSMHKCQGFGVSPRRGSRVEYFEPMAGDTAKANIFEDIDFSWARIKNGSEYQKVVNKLIENYNANLPENSLGNLVELYRLLDRAKSNYWITQKKKEVKDLLLACSGLFVESYVKQAAASRGSKIEVISLLNLRSKAEVKLKKISTSFALKDTTANSLLIFNTPLVFQTISKIPNNAPYTQQYWLEKEGNGKMYVVPDKNYIGKPTNGAALSTRIELEIEGETFVYNIPVKYKYNDAAEGEQKQPFAIVPDVSLEVEQSNYMFVDSQSRDILIDVTAMTENVSGNLFFEMPDGWSIEPSSYNFQLKDIGDNSAVHFTVTPTENAAAGEMLVKAKVGNEIYDRKVIEIKYPHIPTQTVLQAAKTNIVKLNLKLDPKTIGYIMGSGDEIPELLQQLGYKVDLLSDDDIDNADLSKYNTIICGIRAFNVRERLATQQKRLIDYVSEGGTWIVQHNTRFGKQTPQIGPYPFEVTGRSRIAEETATLKILDENHSLMNYPNKISQKDFENWVQERGLYFADSWDEKFTTLLSGNDSGETPKSGGLLYAKYGKGIFIFSGYSFFRELPAGVPGAYRLFVNMISANSENVTVRGGND